MARTSLASVSWPTAFTSCAKRKRPSTETRKVKTTSSVVTGVETLPLVIALHAHQSALTYAAKGPWDASVIP